MKNLLIICNNGDRFKFKNIILLIIFSIIFLYLSIIRIVKIDTRIIRYNDLNKENGNLIRFNKSIIFSNTIPKFKQIVDNSNFFEKKSNISKDNLLKTIKVTNIDSEENADFLKNSLEIGIPEFDKDENKTKNQKLDSIKKVKDYNIIFFETKSQRESFNYRQLCSIESAAKNNPNAKILVFSLSAKIIKKILKTYPNINLKFFEVDQFLLGTFVEKWYQQNKDLILNGRYAPNNISNLLRLVSLWKYGGYYADLDTITVRSIEPLLEYPGVMQDAETKPNNAILNFPEKHPFIKAALDEFMSSFDGSIWGHNGPKLITRTIRKFCQIKNNWQILMFNKSIIESNSTNLSKKSSPCGINIFPVSFSTPLYWKSILFFFQANQKFNFEQSRYIFSLHYFSKVSNEFKVDRNSIFEYYARSHCPVVYGMRSINIR